MLKLILVQRKRKEQRLVQQDEVVISKTYWELPEIVFAVFHFLTREELLNSASLVCKLWYDVAQNKQLWWHHTLIGNPYYFENKKALNFFNAELARKKLHSVPEGVLQH